MIRYRLSESDLKGRIQAHDPGWLEEARRRTRQAKGTRNELASIWSRVKAVYTNIQHGKCAFCERLLGDHQFSSVEFDVEHFRPKNAVKPWPTPAMVKELNLPADFPVSKGKGRGYRLLAYHHLNYASSCKTCNSRLKASYFPIRGKHRFSGADPVALHRTEEPYLIFPLADFDEDPEDLIGFSGYVAMPVKKAGHGRQRARVTIAFFRLNEERHDLYDLRALALDAVRDKLALWRKARSAKKKKEIWDEICRMGDAAIPHAGCVRSFLRKHDDHELRPAALEALELAHEYVRKKYKPWK